MSDSGSSARGASVVTGLFNGRQRAECAYESAINLGYEQSEINLVMSDETRQRFQSGEHRADTGLEDKAAETTSGSPQLADEFGGPTGGVIGTLAPVVAAIGTLVLIPGIAFAGPIAVALTAAGAVGLAGGLVAALTDWGLPEARVHEYESAIRRGGILLGVKARSDGDARQLVLRWKSCGGELIQS